MWVYQQSFYIVSCWAGATQGVSLLQHLLRGLLGCQTGLALPCEEQEATNRRHKCHGQLRLTIIDDLPRSPCRQVPHQQLTSTKILNSIPGRCLRSDAMHRVSKKSCYCTGLQCIGERACCKLNNAHACTGVSSSLTSIVCVVASFGSSCLSHFLCPLD